VGIDVGVDHDDDELVGVLAGSSAAAAARTLVRTSPVATPYIGAEFRTPVDRGPEFTSIAATDIHCTNVVAKAQV
jgi:hypothetical protein